MDNLVSIYTQVYNGERYLEQCIESVLNQTYPFFEWFLIDNGSTDRTREIIQKYEKADSRIHAYYWEKNVRGQGYAFLASHANGKYVVLPDGDDFLNKNYLKKLVYVIEQSSADAACCKAVEFEDETGKARLFCNQMLDGIFSKADLQERYEDIVPYFSVNWDKIIRTDILRKACSVPELAYFERCMRYCICGDNAFMLICLEQCKTFMIIPDILYYYRRHRQSSYYTYLDPRGIDGMLSLYELQMHVLKKNNALTEANSIKVYSDFYGHMSHLLTGIINMSCTAKQKIEKMSYILSHQAVCDIRKQYCDEHNRRMLMSYVAWSYQHIEKESMDDFRNMLTIVAPDFFKTLSDREYEFLISEKIVLSLIILGERGEAAQHLQQLYRKGMTGEMPVLDAFLAL